jgi:hypothetical protein
MAPPRREVEFVPLPGGSFPEMARKLAQEMARGMAQDRAHRIFSIAEANDLVPELARIFDVIRAERSTIDLLLPDIRLAAEHKRESGGSVHGARYMEALERISDTLERVTGMGVLVKDVDQGLCDFPVRHKGKLVLLCWQHGETEVAWWHDLDSGFRGRQPIDDLTGDPTDV